MTLRPWVEGPFEILLHGELHFRSAQDFDRSIALISFDNSIEVSISAYLGLHPRQRGGRTYEREQVTVWTKNFHSRIEFWDCECKDRGVPIKYESADLIYYHSIRNGQYHQGSANAPQWRDIEHARAAAIWLFSILFEVEDVEELLEERVKAATQPRSTRKLNYDRAIDQAFGDFQLGLGVYSASELLHAVDPEAYRDLAIDLLTAPRNASSAA